MADNWGHVFNFLSQQLGDMLDKKRERERQQGLANQFQTGTTDTTFQPQGRTEYGKPEGALDVQYPTTLPTVKPVNQPISLADPRYSQAVMNYLGGGGDPATLNAIMGLREKTQPKYNMVNQEYGVDRVYQTNHGQPPKLVSETKPIFSPLQSQARTYAPSQLKKYEDERAAIIQTDPNDPRIANYDDVIHRMRYGLPSYSPLSTFEGIRAFDKRTGTPSDVVANLPPTVDMRNKEFTLERADPILMSIDELSEKINTGHGVVAKISGEAGKVAARANLNDDIAEYEAIISGFTPLVARALGHVGVLTEQDVQSVKALFPRPGDSKSLRDRKTQRIKTILGALREVKSGGQSGGIIRFDVGGVIYDIPESEAAEFQKEYPNATRK